MKTDTLEQAQADGRAPWNNVEISTRDFIVYNDIYPVTPGHTLVVPRENTEENILKCFNFAQAMGNQNILADNDITGYNIGLNMGTSAGQTCMYPHVHLIFRRDGDMEDPKGGVRGVIPSKQKYTLKDSNQMEFDIDDGVGC